MPRVIREERKGGGGELVGEIHETYGRIRGKRKEFSIVMGGGGERGKGMKGVAIGRSIATEKADMRGAIGGRRGGGK